MFMTGRKYCFGVYKYIDKETGNIVYIGVDSHIDKNRRHLEHLQKAHYNQQPFNKVLQNNKERYEYHVWYHVDSIEEASQLEFDLINLYRPKFNYHHGGCSKVINRNFKYTVTKYGTNHRGKQKYAINDMTQKPLCQSLDFEYLSKIALKLNNGELSPNDAKAMKKPFVATIENKIANSKSKNSTGFYGVSKNKCPSCKSNIIWNYGHVKDGKRIRFEKTNFFDLKKEVEKRKLPWCIIDIDKAIVTVKSFTAI